MELIGISEMGVRFELQKQLAKGARKFYLFPYGDYGKITKKILNEDLGIEELGIFDNCKTGENIKPLDWLKEHPLKEDEYILITSYKPTFYEEIRAEVGKYVSKKQILDLFPHKEVPCMEQYMEDIAKRSGMDIDCIYQLKRYDAKFYLPFWKTDFIQKGILIGDNYVECGYLQYVKWLLGERMTEGTVLDIGANIGNHTVFFAKECGVKKIIAFEPMKQTFDILHKNVEINELEDIVTLYNVGLGEEKGRADAIAYDLENIGGTCLFSSENGELEIRALDDYQIDDKIVLMKIDVEGFESKVIKGALSTIEKNKPYIMVESWDHEETIFDIISMLCPMGYEYIQVSGCDYVFFCEGN